MSAADDVKRLLVLVPWLLERPGAHVDELADVFHTTADQIRRDLAMLDFCGLPGLRGGDLFDVTVINDRATIDLADELKRPLKPTVTEAIRLILLVDAVRVALDDAIPALASASAKLRTMLSLPEETFGLIDETTPAHPLHDLRVAITENRQVTFTYLGRNDATPKPRRVDPVSMHVFDGNWYLEAFDLDRQAGRIFHTDRIADVRITDVPSQPHDLDALLPAYIPDPNDTTVVLHINKPGQWILDHLHVNEIVHDDNDTLVATFTTNALPYIARLVLMARGSVTVAKPETLRTLVKDTARKTLEAYGVKQTD